MENEIGVGTCLTQGGNGSLDVKCGGGAWEKNISDIRNVINDFDYDETKDKGKFVMFLSFDFEGCYVTTLSPLPGGRVEDCLTAYIYIPRTLKLGKDNVYNVLKALKDYILKGEEKVLKNAVKEAKSVKGDCDCPFRYQQSASNGKFAYIQFTSQFRINDFLTDYLYQPIYTEYQRVYLLDEKESLKLKTECESNFHEIKEGDLKKLCVLLKPEVNSNVNVSYKKECDQAPSPFAEKYIQCPEGQKVTLTYKREGFKDQERTIIIAKDRVQKVEGEYLPSNWKKRIDRDSFRVISQQDNKSCGNQQVDSLTSLKVNGMEVPHGGCIYVEEGKLSEAKVEVKAKGYDEYKGTQNLRKASCEIRLKPKYIQKEKKMYLCSPTGEEEIDAKVLYELQDGRTDDFAPKGYECRDCKNYVFKEPAPKPEPLFKLNWLDVLIVAGAMLLLIAFLFLALNRFGGFYCAFPNEQATEQPKSENGTQKLAAPRVSDSGKQEIDYSSAEEAVKYLNGVWTWKKSDMEKYDKLKGLFDDLNSFNFSDLKKKWSPSLKSKRLKNLVDIIRKLKSEPDSAFTKGDAIGLKDYEDFLKQLNASNTSKNGKDKDKK